MKNKQNRMLMELEGTMHDSSHFIQEPHKLEYIQGKTIRKDIWFTQRKVLKMFI